MPYTAVTTAVETINQGIYGKEVKNAIFSCRNAYNRIPHPAQDTQQERNADTKDNIKYKTVQEESPLDNSFLPDGHKAVLNNAKKYKQKYVQTVTIRALQRSNRILRVGLNRIYVRAYNNGSFKNWNLILVV